VGANAQAHGNYSSAFGQGAIADGQNYNTALGESSLARGDDNTATGQHSEAQGDSNSAFGNDSIARGADNTAIGQGAEALGGGGEDGHRNVAVGHDSYAYGDQNTALGETARAIGYNETAVGNGAYASGQNDTAVGANAQVTADHSTALGADAVSNTPNEFMMATKNESYTAPGITSNLSKSRQSGPLEVVTSDANGHLATDGGQIFRRLDENRQGVALALAAVNPDLTRDERFGITANWGGFDGANAFGMGFEGVLGHNWITNGDRVAVTGGWGVGFSDGRGDDVFGGRVGAQWTWGAAPR
jgi:hypothetical protein